jgi:hercynine metabolism protein
MSTWLEQLERELDKRLSEFLRNNPIQDQLFQDQHQQDRAMALKRQRRQLQQDAEEQRRQLLDLADQVKDWRERIQRADRAGATDLADRARHHLNQLMTQGRHLWSDLENLGRRFEEVDGQLAELSRQPQSANQKDLDRDWAMFEAEQELKRMRRDAGLSD